MNLTFFLGLCCQDRPAASSEPYPGSPWHWENSDISHHRVSPGQAGQWVRAALLSPLDELESCKESP